jgi:thiol-disulfide isomerase/thioredoxin
MQSFEGTLSAPEINRAGLGWLNVAEPLSLEDLKGKIVLLDFWTFCCINCMHVLTSLRKVEEAFPDEVVVIGIHSPKFAAERDIENVKNAIARYDIRHPVIHDPEHKLWQEYDVHAWPTLVFIDPHGKIVGKHSGEPDPLHLLNAVRDAIEHFEDKGEMASSLLELMAPAAAQTTLLFPGKIKPLPGTDRQWIVADSGHHQIVVLDDNGLEMRRFGSGQKGGSDGAAHEASFNAPQGLVANTETIFVADTGNHAIRAIDRVSGVISTLAGNGERGMILLNSFEKAKGRALASPWDLEIKGTYLFFANAGTHQIGAIDLSQNVLRVVAGTGGENIRDGNVLAAELAQPSGLVLNSDGTRLYFADSETSSIRFLDMKSATIMTLVGTGLFDFGHHNGPLLEGLLQHALGLCLLDDNKVAVADSYNGALRLIDLEAKTLADLDAEGWTCLDPVCLPLAEPAGIWADGANRILVSDTNNHRIIEIRRDEKTMKTWA